MLYRTTTQVLPMWFELSFKRPSFIICQSPLPTVLCICLWSVIVRFH